MQKIYDPEELAAHFQTEGDETLRATDAPERLQHIFADRDAMAPPVFETSIRKEAEWIVSLLLREGQMDVPDAEEEQMQRIRDIQQSVQAHDSSHRVPPRAATCRHVPPRAATCRHVLPRAATCCHVSPCPNLSLPPTTQAFRASRPNGWHAYSSHTHTHPICIPIPLAYRSHTHTHPTCVSIPHAYPSHLRIDPAQTVLSKMKLGEEIPAPDAEGESWRCQMEPHFIQYFRREDYDGMLTPEVGASVPWFCALVLCLGSVPSVRR